MRGNRTFMGIAAAATVLLLVGCSSDSGAVATGASSEQDSSGSDEATSVPIDADPECSDSTLAGRYLYEVHGDKRFAEGLYPYLEVGELVFDGEGGATDLHTDSISRTESSNDATYEVGRDCRGLATYDDGVEYRLVVSPAGDELTFYQAGTEDPQVGLDGGATLVDEDPDATCDGATLTGAYSYRARGFLDGALHNEHGFETYDGEGTVTNAFSVNGADEVEYLTGTYEVDDSCRAEVTYDSGAVFVQYLAPDGSDFLWIQTEDLDDEGLFGGHEHRVTTSTDPRLTTAAGG